MYYVFEEQGILKAQTLFGEQSGKPALDYGNYKVVDDDTIRMTDTLVEEKEFFMNLPKAGQNLPYPTRNIS